MSGTYTARLSVREETVLYLSSLLHTERYRRGTRAGTRVLSCVAQAVLVLRWFLDGTRMVDLAGDNNIAGSTGYDYLHEGIDVPAAPTPSLRTLGDLGYEGESGTITVGFKKPKGGKLPAIAQQFNKVHNSLRPSASGATRC